MNLQGDCFQYLEDVSLCEEWAGVSLQISENENNAIGAINLANPAGTAWKGLTHILTPESWRKANRMTAPQNSQGRWKKSHTEEKLYGCVWCDDSFSRTSWEWDGPQECKGEEPCRYTDCVESLVMKSTVKQHNMAHAVPQPSRCSNYGMDVTEDADFHAYHSVHITEESCKCDQCGKDFGQSSDLIVHYKTHSA
ncbi:zinc finger protein 285 [Rhinolophus ferrumequinum]|uniref:Zinc finger protein 285 n=2 Tax=Rhinolophus ferrumequinum TaxID=59479 RepID=A0A7J7SLV9_RHIFE|nr:zinc finger protein 285 [Rhinolophus ferrumequinum]